MTVKQGGVWHFMGNEAGCLGSDRNQWMLSVFLRDKTKAKKRAFIN